MNGELIKAGKYGIAGVAIAIIMFMGFLTNKFFNYIESHAEKMTTAIEQNTAVINEFSLIIKNGYSKPAP